MQISDGQKPLDLNFSKTWIVEYKAIAFLIKMRMEIGNVSKRKQLDQRTDNSRSPKGLQRRANNSRTEGVHQTVNDYMCWLCSDWYLSFREQDLFQSQWNALDKLSVIAHILISMLCIYSYWLKLMLVWLSLVVSYRSFRLIYFQLILQFVLILYCYTTVQVQGWIERSQRCLTLFACIFCICLSQVRSL